MVLHEAPLQHPAHAFSSIFAQQKLKLGPCEAEKWLFIPLSVSCLLAFFLRQDSRFFIHTATDSTPLNIHFWLTVKRFPLTAQIENIQWFFDRSGIIILAEEADYRKQALPLVIQASPCFCSCIQLYRHGRRWSVLGKPEPQEGNGPAQPAPV